MSVLQDTRHISLSKCTEENGDSVMSLPFNKNTGGEEDGGITPGICSVHDILFVPFPPEFFPFLSSLFA